MDTPRRTIMRNIKMFSAMRTMVAHRNQSLRGGLDTACISGGLGVAGPAGLLGLEVSSSGWVVAMECRESLPHKRSPMLNSTNISVRVKLRAAGTVRPREWLAFTDCF